jgi:hypothetical protein
VASVQLAKNIIHWIFIHSIFRFFHWMEIQWIFLLDLLNGPLINVALSRRSGSGSGHFYWNGAIKAFRQ